VDGSGRDAFSRATFNSMEIGVEGSRRNAFESNVVGRSDGPGMSSSNVFLITTKFPLQSK
jgi:hypothetical protein